MAGDLPPPRQRELAPAAQSAPPNQQPLCPPVCRGISAVFPRHRRPRPVAAFAWCPWRSCELHAAANSNAPAAWRDCRRGARHRWQPSRPNIVPGYPWPISPRTEAPSSNKTRKGRSKTGSDCFNRAEPSIDSDRSHNRLNLDSQGTPLRAVCSATLVQW